MSDLKNLARMIEDLKKEVIYLRQEISRIKEGSISITITGNHDVNIAGRDIHIAGKIDSNGK